MPLAARRLGFDQRLRLVAPFRPFIGTADPAQKMQCAENLGKPLQVAVIGLGLLGSRRSRLRLRLGLRLNPGLCGLGWTCGCCGCWNCC